MVTLKCKHCGQEFQAEDWQKKRGRKYCSLNCANEAKKGKTPPGFKPGKVMLTCLQCGQEFECWKAWVKRGRRKFCSWDCKTAYQKTLTGLKSNRFGVKHTEETKQKMRGTTRAPGRRNANWKGGKYKTGHGYRYVHLENLQPLTRELLKPMATKAGYIAEHRLVMAIHLGRPLKKEEKVHHVNGNRIDNRIENLMIQDHRIHSQKHREIIHRIGELEKENERLRAEVSRLKSLLVMYQSSG